MSAALDRLLTQLDDVDNLISHHTSGGAVGRPKTNEGPLNRSCVVLTYAAWEVYAEDSLVWAAERLATLPTYASLPEATRAFVADAAAGDPGSLADGGWRSVLVDQVILLTRGDPTTADFGINTAGPRQLAALHRKVLGTQLLDQCKWPGLSPDRVKKTLVTLVKERGSIVHTGAPIGALRLTHVRNRRNFVAKLAQTLDAVLGAWIVGAGATL